MSRNEAMARLQRFWAKGCELQPLGLDPCSDGELGANRFVDKSSLKVHYPAG